MQFNFSIGDTAVINISGEQGTIIGRAQYVGSSDMYQVHYLSGDGNSKTEWFDVSLISVLIDDEIGIED